MATVSIEPSIPRPLAFVARGAGNIARQNMHGDPMPEIKISDNDRISFYPMQESDPPGCWKLKVGDASVYIVAESDVSRIYQDLHAFGGEGRIACIESMDTCESCGAIGQPKTQFRFWKNRLMLEINPACLCITCERNPVDETIKRVKERRSAARACIEIDPISGFVAVVDNGPIFVVYPENRFNLEIHDRATVEFKQDFDAGRWIATATSPKSKPVRFQQVVWSPTGVAWVHAELLKLRDASEARLVEERKLSPLHRIQRKRFSYLTEEID